MVPPRPVTGMAQPIPTVHAFRYTLSSRGEFGPNGPPMLQSPVTALGTKSGAQTAAFKTVQEHATHG